MAGKELRGLRI